ncbi:phospholipase A1-Ibeta2, chloroplastic [Cocos nucifera]|uniref:Phospholipase A1-Ibeta2, chloroplastic n=1 Tax=Cocos nucifera TaxID=13894 RepID=A0A8K0N4G8_COCNU|nr:phospholipase A1-Ibeta2, chloroplastic [Cocos nucifera]
MPPIGTATSAPARHVSPSRSSFPPRHGSPLNPRSHPRALKPTPVSAASSTSTSTSIATKIHLSNLDRVLVKHPSSQPPQLTHDVGREHDPPKPDHLGGGGGVGLLHALNLPSLFPFLRKPAAEEMSPRSLTHLQRLLSDSPRPSPKSSIASRWRLYHGAKDWSGLLDPLDENLRRELLRYGDLVQAAYHAFHSRPAASSPARHRHLLLPDRSYRPTKSLFATSSLSIPPWTRSSASGSAWMTQSSSWIGYVAVCDSDREIRRMGRREIVVVLRGTATCLEWAENLRASLVPMDSPNDSSGEVRQRVPKVARGFWSLYKTAGQQVSSLSASVVEEVRRLVELYKGEELSITVTGHSLGAALAILVADELSTCAPNVPPIAVVSFGGPRVGNRAFADRVKKERGVKVLRIVNAHDVITKVPAGMPLPHVREGYEHVGNELRINSRDSPYLRPDAGPACSHDLEAYLHLVDGFTGTGSPFRSNAKRSLVRLLDQQRRSVKEVYVNRARALGVDPTAAVPLSSPHGCLASPS